MILRRLGIHTVILTGTTTPNCIRTTAYDANSLEYQVVVLEDCCSSQTEEIQRVNMDDMRRMGAIILTSKAFEHYDEHTVVDQTAKIRGEMLKDNFIPEPFVPDGQGGTGWIDRW